ncbi:aminotransferase class V-fold PLP-dependent enzyme [Actinomadura sp. 7K507]|uniref:aminotransferase class V-fold PLP-dependent enzyme n=1 Tax=Actinomadura sp. 7K507 TaxID=2530365 RepID=UPI00104A3479|nr:aminotransferase class V-fold PLP-dependent enzyme [Actinomadura sp. 7K507]TDC86432.1 aminotransferase class V-fold PLP-dependent enzyme [Actinomadura sp. 7K507]
MSALSNDKRSDFPVLRRRVAGRPLVYLDNAATSLRPQPVIDAIVGYQTNNGANIHRGKHLLSEEASDQYEAARLRVAEFIGARSGEVVFVRNTTEALGMVARGLRLPQDSLVVTTLDAHHSNVLPWRQAARTCTIPLTPGGELDLEAYERALRRDPAVVALTACSNVTGIYPPVGTLVKLAKDAGACVVVDAAQYLPHRGGVDEWGADFVAFSGHKMLAPSGVGVLWGRSEALERLDPYTLGGGTVDWVDEEGHRARKLPHRLEYGTPDIGAVIGLDAAVGYLEAIGIDRLAAHDAEMGRTLRRACTERPHINVIGGDEDLDYAGIVSFTVAGTARLDHVARALSDSYGVMCRTGHLCAQPLVDQFAGGQVLRVSCYLYNDPDEIEMAFRAIDSILEAL